MNLSHKRIVKSISGILILLAFIASSYVPLFQSSVSPTRAYAEGSKSCLTSSAATSSTSKKTSGLASHSPRVGGVALDMAAKFLANMNDVTGAYYDATLDRIVFVGKTNTPLPQFDRDDLAVSIKAVIYNNAIPAVSIDRIPNTPPDHPFRKVTYYGGIENTKFGKVLFDADYALKKYSHGYDENQQRITSSVPSYISFFDRFIANGPNPFISGNNSRVVIRPKLITLKKDDPTNSFVFDQAIMKVDYEKINPNNDPAWDSAGIAFTNDLTNNFDAYAQEQPSWAQAKQLGKIVSVIKWIKDNGIVTDFNFARDYAPKFVQTPVQINTLFTPEVQGHQLAGHAQYDTANSYSPDSGTATSLKNSSQAVPTTKEDVHWTFTNNGQQYDAVAVTADAFRSLGSYNTTVTDMSFSTAGDLTLAFQRVYSSFSGGQYGVGRGWNIYPASLFDNDPTHTFTCSAGTYPKALAIASQTGGFESFIINDCNIGYVPDDPAYHSKVFRNADSTFTVRTKDQTEYSFNATYKLTKIKDKNNNVITYNYDGAGKLADIADGKGHQITVNYATFNGQTLISSVTDWSGRAVTYTYDDQGNLLTVKDANNNVTTYTYDTNYKLTTITDRNNQLMLTNTYNDEARVVTQKDAVNVTRTFTYDKTNRIITDTDNQTPTKTVTSKYDTKARILEQTDPLSQKITYTYGSEFAPLTIKDKRNNTITNTYDADGNLKSITYPDTKKMLLEYDAKNRVTKATDERYGTPGKVTTYTYDSLGNLTQMNEANQITFFTYDASGETLTTTDPLSHVITWTRDTFGNILTEKDALNKITTFEYDTIGRLKKRTDADAKSVSYTYDNNSNLITQVDGLGTTTNTYDKENRLTKITLPDNTISEFTYNTAGTLTTTKDPSLSTYSYGYDAYQNLTTQTDALSRVTNYAYDALNRQTSSTTPLGKQYTYEYDPNGNITKRIDANNNATTYLYNSLNQLIKITYPDTKTVTFEYDPRGNRTKMIDPVGTSTFTYDTFDRLTQSSNVYGHIIKYEYDNANNMTKLIYPDNTAVTYTYDNNNRMTSVKDWSNKITTYTYNNNGTLATRLLPNTIKTTYTYDATNKIKTITHAKSTTTLAKYEYTRDLVGNITIATESGSFIGTTKTAKFTYDAIGRIINAVYPSNNTYTYTYDKVGNRLNLAAVNDYQDGTFNKTYTYDADNKLTKINTYSNFTYDNNGNMTRKPSEAPIPDTYYTFDFENRLTKFYNANTLNTWNYKYDGLGNRLERELTTAISRYVTDMSSGLPRTLAIASAYGSGGVTQKFTYGLGILSDDGSKYHLEDGMGNIRFMSNSSGGKGETLSYDPFGRFRSFFGSNDINFQSQWFDSESDLYFMRARHYDPDLGRFISRDPVKGTLVSPQSQNPYAYALNNPIINSDPSGEYVDTVIDVAFLAYDLCEGNYGWAAVDVAMMLLPIANSAIVRGGAHAMEAATKAKRMEQLQETAKIGREVHKAQQYPLGFVKEQTLENGLRPDAINIELKKIIELKPDNPNAIKRGEGQLQKYIEQANKEFGPGFTGEVWTYKR